MDANLDETLALSRSLVDLRPDDADVWLGLANAQVTVGDYVAARESAVRAAELLRQSNESEIGLIQIMHRVDVAAAVEGVERELRAGRRSTGELYQLHRVLLWAGMVERAASLADDYLAADPDSDSAAMVRIRQACAEGRVADADAAFAALDTTDPSSMRSQNAWLYLLTLGRNEDATETLRPYDEDGDFFALSNYLFYTSFDPALYPNFNKHLAKQGVHRPPAAIIPFACER
jgi:tetratricopeptide (TPR) repeat protein